MGREKITDWPENNPPMPPLGELARFYETATNFVHPCRVIGIGVNGLGFSDEEVERECVRVEEESLGYRRVMCIGTGRKSWRKQC